ncbi:glycosyltransferase family 39 protein [Patescibacteria group bacterium]|nr:glycosyltransferase family 39 protein [Patescibacteria group bacterium]
MEKKDKLLVTLLIGGGFFLRIWRLRELMGFDYDQEVAAFAVDRILSGKLTLIGQEISTGGVFIGPGYYYLLTVFYWAFGMDPIGAGVMVALISVATMAVLFVFTRELFDNKTAFIALLMYATSARINFYDRTTAPSNPLMLAGLLTLLLLWKMRRGRVWLLPLAIMTALIATVHLHPSAAVVLPLGAVLWIHWKLPRPSMAQVIASIAAATIVISPLILFDIRHDFLNSKGIIDTLKAPGNEAYAFPFKLLMTLRIQAENLASLFAVKKGFGIVLGLATMTYMMLSKRGRKRLLWLWILIPSVVFSFYTRHIPEYYFLSAFPALVIILASSVSKLSKNMPAILTALLVAIVVVPNLLGIIKSTNPYSLKHKWDTVNYIKKKAGRDAVVAFDTDVGLEAGFRFLLSQAEVRFDSLEAPTHTIVIPPERRHAEGEETTFGGIKVIKSQEVGE